MTSRCLGKTVPLPLQKTREAWTVYAYEQGLLRRAGQFLAGRSSSSFGMFCWHLLAFVGCFCCHSPSRVRSNASTNEVLRLAETPDELHTACKRACDYHRARCAAGI